MARDVVCDMDQVEVASWMLGNLKTGDQLALCDGCLTMYMLAQLDAILPPEAKAAVVAQWSPKTAPTQEGEPATPARRKRVKRGDGQDGAGAAGADHQAAETAEAAPEAASEPQQPAPRLEGAAAAPDDR